MNPVAEYKSADEMIAAYKARKARTSAPSRVVNVASDLIRKQNAAMKAEIAEPREQLSGLEGELATKDRQLVALGDLLDQKADDIKRFKNTISIQRNEIERLRKALYGETGKVPSILEIVEDFLADYPGFTVDDVKSSRQDSELVRIRDGAIWAVYKVRPDLSYVRIGKFFGGRDHSTISYSVKKTRRKQERAA